MYLNDLAEEMHEFKVVTYTDHRRDSTVRYFNDYQEALKYWKSQLLRSSSAKYTATAAIIKTITGEPVMRQTWRV